MARVLYAVSPIGLGHATRAIAIGEQLSNAGAEVVYASGGTASHLLKMNGFRAEAIVTEPPPKVKGGEMKNAIGWYFGYWSGFRSSKVRMRSLIEKWNPDVIVGDEEFTSVTLALEMGVRHAMITDELELGFARSWLAKKVEARVAEWYSGLQRRASQLIIPDSGTDAGNRRYVGPIVRRRTKDREVVNRDYSLPQEGRIVLVAMSGTGIGDYIVDRLLRSDAQFEANIVIIGNRQDKFKAKRVFDIGLVKDGQNIVAAADVVVSTAGKSTIDEAACFGTPIVAIPIRNHSEQERNAAALGYSADDIERLPELVAQKIGRRDAARDFGGAAAASRLILSAL